MELEALQASLEKFTDRGATVVAFCPQRQEFNDAIKDELGLGFPVMRDADNRIATEFGLTLPTPPKVIEAEQFLGLDLLAHNDASDWDLPMPARYVIDAGSTIRYASVHVDHRQRNEPAECLAVLDSL